LPAVNAITVLTDEAVPTREVLAAGKIERIRPISEMIGSMPATRYYGSKRRFLPWILKALSGVKFDSALDAFGGTASVALLFKAMRKTVTFHDGLAFNQDTAATVLADSLPVAHRNTEAFCESVVPMSGVVERNFGSLYYTRDENRWIDGFMYKLESSPLDYSSKSFLRHLIYQACLKKRPYNAFHRANLSLRTNSGVVRSFGNLSTWNKSFSDHIKTTYHELERGIISNGSPVHILPPADILDIEPGYDLAYFDPPYVSNSASKNADNYWRRYHFLEGLSNYSTWEDKIDKESKIRIHAAPQWMRDWQNKALSKELLFSLIRRHSSSVCVLSYASDAHPTFSEIQTFFEQTFVETRLFTVASKYALSASRRRELLFVGIPKQ
jgi:adenine-specific DNA-methyltransferase